MKNKSLWVFLGLVVGVLLLVSMCVIGFAAGSLVRDRVSGFLPESVDQILAPSGTADTTTTTDATSTDATPAENESSVEAETAAPTEQPAQSRDELFGAFWQAWDLVHDQYVDQPVDDTALMQGAIRGMLEALGDQHTSYLTPEDYDTSNAQLNGDEYEGIGAWVDITGEYLTVISPMPGSPAEKAGVKAGDQVIKVDGEDMTGIDGEAVRQKVLGPRGSKVILTVLRKGIEEPIDIEITRGSIITPTIESRMLEENSAGTSVADQKIAYVRLLIFGDDTGKDLRAALKDLLKQNPNGMILDLRNNGGGYLQTAIDVASEFIPDGVIMLEKYGDGSQDTYNAQRGGIATQIPLVVLVNEGSASASEIVAGAIQDRGRGKLVGMTTFGKGSVQVYTPLMDEQGAVRITIARWLTPNGRTIHQKGLEPDVVVEFSDADIENNIDVQLDKAIELLSK